MAPGVPLGLRLQFLLTAVATTMQATAADAARRASPARRTQGQSRTMKEPRAPGTPFRQLRQLFVLLRFDRPEHGPRAGRERLVHSTRRTVFLSGRGRRGRRGTTILLVGSKSGIQTDG